MSGVITSANAAYIAGATSLEAKGATAATYTAATSAKAAVVAAAPTVESISLALAFGIAACGLGEILAGALGLPSVNLAAMAVVASLFASVGSSIIANKDPSGAATPFKGAIRIAAHQAMYA